MYQRQTCNKTNKTEPTFLCCWLIRIAEPEVQKTAYWLQRMAVIRDNNNLHNGGLA